MFTKIGDFFIDQWLWNVTWDWYHIPISIFFMALLLKFFLRMNVISCVVIAVSSVAASFITYTLVVVGVLVYALNFNYNQLLQNQEFIIDPLHACFYLALLYTMLQAAFFALLNRYYPISQAKVLMCAAIANLLTAGVVYLVLPSKLM
jgi:hypothetical protein